MFFGAFRRTREFLFHPSSRARRPTISGEAACARRSATHGAPRRGVRRLAAAARLGAPPRDHPRRTPRGPAAPRRPGPPCLRRRRGRHRCGPGPRGGGGEDGSARWGRQKLPPFRRKPKGNALVKFSLAPDFGRPLVGLRGAIVPIPSWGAPLKTCRCTQITLGSRKQVCPAKRGKDMSKEQATPWYTHTLGDT